MLKYLARYLTGGPISDQRLISDENGDVTFWARTGTTPGGDRAERQACPLTGAEFVQRWSLHILPNGFVKTRRLGGYSNRHRQRYRSTCEDLLPCRSLPLVPAEPFLELPRPGSSPDSVESPDPDAEAREPTCAECGGRMPCVADQRHESWFAVLHGPDRPHW